MVLALVSDHLCLLPVITDAVLGEGTVGLGDAGQDALTAGSAGGWRRPRGQPALLGRVGQVGRSAEMVPYGSARCTSNSLLFAQCRTVKISILGDEGVPVQVDGEAWVQPPGYIRIVHKNRAQMLTRDRVSGTNAWPLAPRDLEFLMFRSKNYIFLDTRIKPMGNNSWARPPPQGREESCPPSQLSACWCPVGTVAVSRAPLESGGRATPVLRPRRSRAP